MDLQPISDADWAQMSPEARASDFERLKGQLQTLVADAIQKAEERLPSYKKLRALHRIQAWFVPIGSALVSGLGIVSIANLNNPAISGGASLAAVLVSVAVGTYGSFKPASDAEYSLLRLRLFITRHEAIHDQRTREWNVFVDEKNAPHQAHLNACTILTNTIEDLKLAATSDDIDIRDPMAVAKTLILKASTHTQ